MNRKIRFCQSCGKYTMEQKCRWCQGESIPAGPLRFSPEDRMGRYRRMGKKQLMERGTEIAEKEPEQDVT